MAPTDDPAATDGLLPPLPLEAWEPTKDTLHLFLQIIGKVRLASAAPRNHWWHVPLYVDVRGLTTLRLHHDGIDFGIDVDVVDHAVVIRTATGGERRVALRDGLSVAAFHDELMAALASVGIRPRIRPVPFGVPMTTPFPEDTEHASYDRDAVERFFRVLGRADRVLHRFAGRFSGKASPVHLFWHSFDLAYTRFSGRPAGDLGDVDAVTREAYSHEVISFGFWAGDHQIREPAFYAYAAPEPEGLRDERLEPDGARWIDQGGSSMALYPYDVARTAADPDGAILAFLEAAYRAGARRAGWDEDALASSWAPPFTPRRNR